MKNDPSAATISVDVFSTVYRKFYKSGYKGAMLSLSGSSRAVVHLCHH